ncbi:hypothetical protein Clacol_001935 [Clathrus columnatus]|uniref:F-box/LRR-repeat protein n=1 Tax=Clathrus columnatus TaxID=1419009 RepID=A0AAV5A3Z5_9AGAM|nr:hypothetical protein Clacol_001935 [Clathrus columnatus]
MSDALHTSTVTARVCQIWFTQSVSIIWHTVELNDALNVILPFIQSGGFQQPSIPHPWHRFCLYAKYVRFLKCFDINSPNLEKAVGWEPCKNIFKLSSRLTVLHWRGVEKHIDCLPSFLTPTLQLLHISLDVITKPKKIDDLFKSIATRSPSLFALQLVIPFVKSHGLTVSHSLQELIQALSQLVSVDVPINLVTPDLFTILSKLPNLEDLTLFESTDDYDIQKEEAFYKWSIKQSGKGKENEDSTKEELLPFPSLRDFYISDMLHNQSFTVAKALKHGVQFLKLSSLTCSPYYEESDQIVELMKSVHVVCPNLREIKLHQTDSPVDDIPWAAILPLLQCLELHTLHVDSCTVNMGLKDLVSLTTNRPFWKNVGLPSTVPLSYRALITFAQNCPNIVKLSLTLDPHLNFPDLAKFKTEVSLPSLTVLDVKNSYLTETSQIKIGLFLASICKNPLEIQSYGGGKSSWQYIQKMVNYIIKLKKEVTQLRQSVKKALE